MIKKIITTTTLLAASVALANAATVVFTTNNGSVTGSTEKIVLNKMGDSGSTGSNSTTTNNTYTYTASTKFDGSNALTLAYKLSSTKCWVEAKSLSTNTNSALTNSFSSASGLSLSDYAGQNYYGGGGGGTTATLTFSGLKANTQYRVSFVAGARDENNTAGTLTLTTGSLFSTTEGGGSFYGSLSGTDTTNVTSFDSSNGISLASVQYTTDTTSTKKSVPTVASTAISVVVTSDSNGTLVFNATNKPGFALIAISDSIPEPSAFSLLAGLGALALTVSRRRRKN